MLNKNRLFVILLSFAALFFEILVIRWLSTEIRIFGYFKNLILMGAFVGLGLGCATSTPESSEAGTKKSSLADFFPYLLLVLTALIAGAPYIGLNHINFVLQTDVFFWLQKADIISSMGQLVTNVGWIILLFLIVVGVFDSLGQLLGRELAKQESLEAYAANLGGSAVGVLVYNLLAFMKTPPGVWLLVGCASLLPFYKKPPQIVALCACVAIAFWSGASSSWSPYYSISTEPYMAPAVNGAPEYPVGFSVLANHVPFQRAIDMSKAFIAKHPDLKLIPEYNTYDVPYEVREGAQDVLVLGAGTGDDVSAALRNGAKHVDAVEIDPTILALGRVIHPEHPYNDPRVSVYINDARNYISSNKKKYDLVVFGFVDSTVSFSMLSSVRLDNFLYTVESLKLVTSSLGPDGIGCISFAAGAPWVRDRLFQAVEAAAGNNPIALKGLHSNGRTVIILWGPGLTPARRALLQARSAELIIPSEQLRSPLPLPTDDWPFLYQKERGLTYAYGIMLALLLVIAGSLTVARFRLHPKSFFQYSQFFFLGAGFLLLETRAMLAVAILFGSTWLVSSIVIFLILVMALLANWLVQRFRNFSANIAYGGLLISLLVLYLVPLSALSGLETISRLSLATLIIGLPFAFAGLVFSTAYSKTTEPNKALGINILGALLGGCLEYLSVIIGTRDLVLIGILLYGLSFVAAMIIKKRMPLGPLESNN